MKAAMQPAPFRPRRSVLYVPASSERALAKVASLACDAVILDLEDAVAPSAKAAARERLAAFLKAPMKSPSERPEIVVRVNPPSGEWGADDLKLAGALQPDAILLPKVDTPRDILEAGDALDDAFVADSTKLWAMIETPKALLNVGAIAELGRDPASRLACLVAGSNDIAKETGIRVEPDRRYLLPLLLQIVVAARAGGLCALDGVLNDFRDGERLARECAEAASMGFDGKTLIHPDQIGPANAAFAPDEAELAVARAVVAAFALPENAGKGVVAVDGRMTERLHLAQAEALLARAAMIEERGTARD
jgi:citrate lyase subunit beta/citryl-CoA lyase